LWRQPLTIWARAALGSVTENASAASARQRGASTPSTAKRVTSQRFEMARTHGKPGRGAAWRTSPRPLRVSTAGRARVRPRNQREGRGEQKGLGEVTSFAPGRCSRSFQHAVCLLSGAVGSDLFRCRPRSGTRLSNARDSFPSGKAPLATQDSSQTRFPHDVGSEDSGAARSAHPGPTVTEIRARVMVDYSPIYIARTHQCRPMH
jgi:hypothetical protein